MDANMISLSCQTKVMRSSTNKPLLQIIVKSRLAMELFVPDAGCNSYIVISITTPGDDDATISQDDRLLGILPLSFYVPLEDAAEEGDFSITHASTMWSFVQKHIESIDTIVVHCDQGVCRSYTIAAAIAYWLTGYDASLNSERPFEPYIYNTMLDAAPPELKETRSIAK